MNKVGQSAGAGLGDHMQSTDPPEKRAIERQNALWFYAVVRPISLPILQMLMAAGFTPNQVSILYLLTGVIGAGLIATGDHAYAIGGALLLHLAMALDCADGAIARLKDSVSKQGEFLDNSLGYVVISSIFIGWGIGAYNQVASSGTIGLGLTIFAIDSGAWVSMGMIIGIIFLLTRILSLEFRQIGSQGASQGLQNARFGSVMRILRNIADPGGGVLPVLLVGSILRALPLALLAYCLIIPAAFSYRFLALFGALRSLGESGSNGE